MSIDFPNPSLRYSIVETTLAREIADGHWRPGARLPGENALIERFCVSRSTVRRATQNLALRGLVKVFPGRGTFVLHCAAGPAAA
jgi:GntR family transcriptional regulator